MEELAGKEWENITESFQVGHQGKPGQGQWDVWGQWAVTCRAGLDKSRGSRAADAAVLWLCCPGAVAVVLRVCLPASWYPPAGPRHPSLPSPRAPLTAVE